MKKKINPGDLRLGNRMVCTNTIPNKPTKSARLQICQRVPYQTKNCTLANLLLVYFAHLLFNCLIKALNSSVGSDSKK